MQKYQKIFIFLNSGKITGKYSYKNHDNLLKKCKRDIKDEFNISPNNCYDEYEKLLKNNEVDIIYIALPNNFHSEWIYRSIELNKHILVEKPAFINFKDAQKILSHPNLNNFFLLGKPGMEKCGLQRAVILPVRKTRGSPVALLHLVAS